MSQDNYVDEEKRNYEITLLRIDCLKRNKQDLEKAIKNAKELKQSDALMQYADSLNRINKRLLEEEEIEQRGRVTFLNLSDSDISYNKYREKLGFIKEQQTDIKMR